MRYGVDFVEDDLLELAGARSFERGLGYLDAVTWLEVGEDGVTGRVQGTEVYEVELVWDVGGGLDGGCDCPYGQEGHFCKHCVAVGLVVLRQAEGIPRQREAAASWAEGLRSWLESLSRDELLELVNEQLGTDRELRRRLELRAAAARSDLGAVRERVLALLDPSPYARYGYIEYADAHGYAQQAEEAVSAVRRLTADGQAGDAVQLAQEAIRRLGAVYDEIDDSDGVVGNVGTGLAEAHLKACLTARPDPVVLADWLVGQTLGDHDYVAEIDVFDYREALGDAGLARVRKLAAAAHRRDPSSWAAQHLKERLIKAEGDLDALIDLWAADLAPNGSTHLRIAAELDTAGRTDEALAWAERGLKATLKTPDADSRLADYVCASYAAAGRTDDVLAVRRDRFHAQRSLVTYQELRAAAQAAGSWEGERAKALQQLRGDVRRQRHGRHGGPVLIDALIDDGDYDAAWQAADGCAADRQWRTLADHCTETRPADALAVYLRLIEPLKQHTGNGIYEQIARLLLGARTCHQKLGTQAEFAAYLAALRAEQKRKRNLMKLLDHHGL